MHRVTAILLGGMFLALTACDPLSQPESMLETYVERAARVLDETAELTPVMAVPQLPRKRDRVRELPDLDLGMLDFLSLYGCELQHVISERNSILGRVMHPVNQLHYELRFVRSAQICLEEIDSERRARAIAEAIEIKRAALPDVIWNAVWSSSEIEAFLTRSKGPLRIDVDRDLASVLAADLYALESVAERIRHGEVPDLEVTALDGIYQRWQSRPLAGQVIRSAVLIAARLDDVSRLIEPRLKDRPVCARPDHQPRAALNMQGMFMTVYIGHVQPYLAAVQRVRNELMPTLQSLAAMGAETRTPAMTEYAHMMFHGEVEGSVWWNFDRAVARHTELWQKLLEQCGMRPQS
ncbi:MAG TPA: DUF3080 family protein [Azoarcus sp.]|nr:DUF3080 family protein [Azoarcus sp.]